MEGGGWRRNQTWSDEVLIEQLVDMEVRSFAALKQNPTTFLQRVSDMARGCTVGSLLCRILAITSGGIQDPRQILRQLLHLYKFLHQQQLPTHTYSGSPSLESGPYTCMLAISYDLCSTAKKYVQANKHVDFLGRPRPWGGNSQGGSLSVEIGFVLKRRVRSHVGRFHHLGACQLNYVGL